MTDLVIIFFRELMDCSHRRTWLAGWTLLPNVTHFKYYNLPLSVVTCSREAGVPCDPHRPCEGWDKQHPSPPDRRIGLSTHLDWGHYGCYSSRERAHGTELKANRRPLGWLGYFVYPKYMMKILEAPPVMEKIGQVKWNIIMVLALRSPCKCCSDLVYSSPSLVSLALENPATLLFTLFTEAPLLEPLLAAFWGRLLWPSLSILSVCCSRWCTCLFWNLHIITIKRKSYNNVKTY